MTYINHSLHTRGDHTCNCSTVIKLTFTITITNVGGKRRFLHNRYGNAKSYGCVGLVVMARTCCDDSEVKR